MKKIVGMVVMFIATIVLTACRTSLDEFELLEMARQADPPTSGIVDVQVDAVVLTEGVTIEMPMTLRAEIESKESMYMKMNALVIGEEIDAVTFIREGYVYRESETNQRRSERDHGDVEEIAGWFLTDLNHLSDRMIEDISAERTSNGYRLELTLNQEGLFAVLNDFEDASEMIDFFDLNEENIEVSSVTMDIYIDENHRFMSSETSWELVLSFEDLGMTFDLEVVGEIAVEATDVTIDFPDWLDELNVPASLVDSEIIGLWEHGSGDILLFVFGRADSVKFLEDGTVIIVEDDESRTENWRTDEPGAFTADGRSFTYAVGGDVLTITDSVDDDWSFYREGVAPTASETPFLGVWEYGIGNRLPRFWEARGIEFLADGTVYHWSSGNREFETSSTWELNEAGELIVQHSDEEIAFSFEISGDRMTLIDEEEDARMWWREGKREIPDDLELMGIWEYAHGHRLAHPDATMRRSDPNRPHGIEFSEDQLFFIDREGNRMHSHRFWDLDEAGYLILEAWGNARILSIELSDDTLIIIDEEGNAGTWFRTAADFEDSQDWVITDYLDFFEIDDGYRIVHNIEVAGEQFDFIIYDLESEAENEGIWPVNDWYFIVIVKQNDHVLQVIRQDVQSPSVTVNDLVVEVDLTFDGQNDLLLFNGDRFGVGGEGSGYGGSHRYYDLFLQRYGWLEHIPSFANICSPYLDVDNHRLIAMGRMVRAPFQPDYKGCAFGSRVYEFINNEWVMVAELVTEPGGLRRERLLIGGIWQERELCMRTTWDDGEESRELCTDHNENDIILYERIFGEHPFWFPETHSWSLPIWREQDLAID